MTSALTDHAAWTKCVGLQDKAKASLLVGAVNSNISESWGRGDILVWGRAYDPLRGGQRLWGGKEEETESLMVPCRADRLTWNGHLPLDLKHHFSLCSRLTHGTDDILVRGIHHREAVDVCDLVPHLESSVNISCPTRDDSPYSSLGKGNISSVSIQRSKTS